MEVPTISATAADDNVFGALERTVFVVIIPKNILIFIDSILLLFWQMQ